MRFGPQRTARSTRPGPPARELLAGTRIGVSGASTASIRFGPSLLVAALISGLTHLFNNFNPLVGHYRLWSGWELWAVVGGIFFGLIRERYGSLLAPGIAHGLLDAVARSFAVLFGGTR
jgi:membrane protease YdiL (CAAX protease family)